MCHAAKPPKTLLQALPEPCLQEDKTTVQTNLRGTWTKNTLHRKHIRACVEQKNKLFVKFALLFWRCPPKLRTAWTRQTLKQVKTKQDKLSKFSTQVRWTYCSRKIHSWFSPKQAYPAAEDARPAAVGKLFSEQMCSFWSFKLSASSLLESFRFEHLSRTATAQIWIQTDTQHGSVFAFWWKGGDGNSLLVPRLTFSQNRLNPGTVNWLFTAKERTTSCEALTEFSNEVWVRRLRLARKMSPRFFGSNEPTHTPFNHIRSALNDLEAATVVVARSWNNTFLTHQELPWIVSLSCRCLFEQFLELSYDKCVVQRQSRHGAAKRKWCTFISAENCTSFWCKVALNDEFTGRISRSSLFPPDKCRFTLIKPVTSRHPKGQKLCSNATFFEKKKKSHNFVHRNEKLVRMNLSWNLRTNLGGGDISGVCQEIRLSKKLPRVQRMNLGIFTRCSSQISMMSFQINVT